MELVVTKVFEKNFYSTGKIVINRGGTRAGKTYSICQMLVNWLLTGVIRDNLTIEKGVASVVRKTLPALKATALKDFEEILANTGYYNLISINKTDREYKYKGRDRYKSVYLVDAKDAYYQIESDMTSLEEGREMTTAIFHQMIKKNIFYIE